MERFGIMHEIPKYSNKDSYELWRFEIATVCEWENWTLPSPLFKRILLYHGDMVNDKKVDSI